MRCNRYGGASARQGEARRSQVRLVSDCLFFFFKGMRPRRYLNRHSYGGASARQGGAWSSQGRGGRAASAQFTCFYQYKRTLTDAFGGRQGR
jgi:hypothetical protein